jgi:hypothetical protein
MKSSKRNKTHPDAKENATQHSHWIQEKVNE